MRHRLNMSVYKGDLVKSYIFNVADFGFRIKSNNTNKLKKKKKTYCINWIYILFSRIKFRRKHTIRHIPVTNSDKQPDLWYKEVVIVCSYSCLFVI